MLDRNKLILIFIVLIITLITYSIVELNDCDPGFSCSYRDNFRPPIMQQSADGSITYQWQSTEEVYKNLYKLNNWQLDSDRLKEYVNNSKQWQSSFVIPGFVQDDNPSLRNISDFNNQDVYSLFSDADSDGKAVLIGCPQEWNCRQFIETQIKENNLRYIEVRTPNTIEEYWEHINNAYLKAKPILFYHWSPSPTVRELDVRIVGDFK